MIRRARAGAAVILGMIAYAAVPAPGAAQSAPAPDPAPPADAIAPASQASAAQLPASSVPMLDAVVLLDGRSVHGTILQHEPGSYLALRLPDGRDLLLNAAFVTQVIPAAAPATPPPGLLTAPASAAEPTQVTVETRMAVDTAQGTVSHEVESGGDLERTLLDVKAGTARRETVDAAGNTTAIELNVAGSASYTATTDCSDSDSGVCEQKTDLNLSSGGLTASYQETRVEAVREPPNRYGLLSMGAGITAVLGEFEAFGGNISLSYRGGLGGKLPGAEGGTWHGLGYDLGGQLSYITFDGGDSGQLDFGLAAGWTGLSFGALNPSNLQQRGFGWMLGARLGVTYLLGSDADPNVSVGPQITISLPRYNAGTAKVSDLNLTFFLLPTSHVTVVMVQLGFGMGL